METRPTVFAIDDDAAILDALKYVVEELGFVYEAFPSAQAFWQARDPDKTGCLILDIGMPDQTGEELFDALAATGRTWPTIAITGRGEFALGVRMVKKGVFDFLEKPFSADHLKTLIQQAIEIDRMGKLERQRGESLREVIRSLNEDQKAILREIRRGASSREIAARLDVSLRTVQLRRSEIAKKLGVQGRSGWSKLLFALGEIEI